MMRAVWSVLALVPFSRVRKPLLPRAITSPPLRLKSVRAVGIRFAELHYEVPHPPKGRA